MDENFKDLEVVNAQFQAKVKDALVKDGFDVVVGEEVIWKNSLAVKYGKMMAHEDVDCVIFNYCVGLARVCSSCSSVLP